MIFYLDFQNGPSNVVYAWTLPIDSNKMDEILDSEDFIENIICELEEFGVLDLSGDDRFVGYSSDEVELHKHMYVVSEIRDFFVKYLNLNIGILDTFANESEMRSFYNET